MQQLFNIKIFLLLIFLLQTAACSNKTDWHQGSWIIDENLTNTARGSNENDFIALTMRLMRGLQFTITTDNLNIQHPKKPAVNYQYQLVSSSDGNIIIDIPNHELANDLHLGKDDKGVYMLAEEFEKVGDITQVSKQFKIYLKPAAH